MRLWHYKLIPFLPKSQLLAQWRELNSIFKKQDKHILINYIYEYPKDDLYTYTNILFTELAKRHINIKSLDNFYEYFDFKNNTYLLVDEPFRNHHNYRYLLQNYFNLQEKYDRGQKDFTEEQLDALNQLVNEEWMREKFHEEKECEKRK